MFQEETSSPISETPLNQPNGKENLRDLFNAGKVCTSIMTRKIKDHTYITDSKNEFSFSVSSEQFK